MKRTRSRPEPARSNGSNGSNGASTRVRARELAEVIRNIASADGQAPSAADAEIVDRLWVAWIAARGKQARQYLMSLILLAKRATADRRAADELARRLRPTAARARIPGLPDGKTAEGRLRREVERLAKLEPRGRGRPRKGEPKPRFYKEVLRALPALGIEPVTERQLIRDWRAAVAEARANGRAQRGTRA